MPIIKTEIITTPAKIIPLGVQCKINHLDLVHGMVPLDYMVKYVGSHMAEGIAKEAITQMQCDYFFDPCDFSWNFRGELLVCEPTSKKISDCFERFNREVRLGGLKE